jgi:transcriptional regulator with XRE-family HTH domain
MRNDIYLKEMGKKIKAIRESKKITLRRLGELCGLDYSNISRLESGTKDCHLLTLKNIADKLKVDVKDFI